MSMSKISGLYYSARWSDDVLTLPFYDAIIGLKTTNNEKKNAYYWLIFHGGIEIGNKLHMEVVFSTYLTWLACIVKDITLNLRIKMNTNE